MAALADNHRVDILELILSELLYAHGEKMDLVTLLAPAIKPWSAAYNAEMGAAETPLRPLVLVTLGLDLILTAYECTLLLARPSSHSCSKFAIVWLSQVQENLPHPGR